MKQNSPGTFLNLFKSLTASVLNINIVFGPFFEQKCSIRKKNRKKFPHFRFPPNWLHHYPGDDG